jgi:ABC-type multidrug transport system ATPase subunit
VLVLDEATSAVDPHTETLIQSALRRLLQARTSLVIAHRLSTILDVDRIVVLHHGRVREMGTHAELLQRGGIYARLWELSCLSGDRLATRSETDVWTIWQRRDCHKSLTQGFAWISITEHLPRPS